MKIETLVITMNQTDISKYYSMNIEGDALISNQIKGSSSYVIQNNIDYCIKFISIDCIGVGRNRNQALLLAEGDILVFADDDTIFTPGYTEKIISDFNNNDVDMMIYSMVFKKNGIETYRRINKNKRIRKVNCLKYGGASIVVRRDTLLKNNIWFSLLFGGGTPHGSGEDSIFIMDYLNSHLCVKSSDYILGECHQDNSTWFQGYNKKYFYDKGFLFKTLFPKVYPFIIFQFAIRHYSLFKGEFRFNEIIKMMYRGSLNLNINHEVET